MLQLKDVKKDYLSGQNTVQALKGINLSFRDSEFTSILGPSGCGKTTLLNIIGGLDKYTSGDLVISGKSTKDFTDSDWDDYRNAKIGFIFQNYHLIPHLNVLENVEIALTIGGVSAAERKKRATEALDSVGLTDKLYQNPNQLSGGQMQRVSIARALVNNPEIILADEPTGALDSVTSVQIMDLLAEIAKTRLVILVTHNAELAEKYSTRIINLFDGLVTDDTNPFDVTQKEPGQQKTAFTRSKARKISSMPFLSAIKLSARNLLTKKTRTTITAIAGSIGIIGVGLVLALSNGFTAYLNNLEMGPFGSFPIMVSEISYNFDIMQLMQLGQETGNTEGLVAFPSTKTVIPKQTSSTEDLLGSLFEMVTLNDITDEYRAYVEKMDKKLGEMQYSYTLNMHFMAKNNIRDELYFPNINDLSWQKLLGSEGYVLGQYELVAGDYPSSPNEIVVIMDKYNRIDEKVLTAIGVGANRANLKYSDILTAGGGGNLKLMYNDGYYAYNDKTDTYKETSKLYATNADWENQYNDAQNTEALKVVGILRVRPNIDYELMTPGLAYLDALDEKIFETEKDSEIVKAQTLEENKGRDVMTGEKFAIDFNLNSITSLNLNEYLKMAGKFFNAGNAEYLLNARLRELGGIRTPSAIYIYPKDFQSKTEIKNYLDGYNKTVVDEDSQVEYMDMTEVTTSTVSEIIRIVSIILVCFAAISLVVSSLMIGIVTYVSVIERTGEIGILRSLGASKLDVSNIFNAETTIIGFVSGILGILITYLISLPANLIIKSLTGITANLAALAPLNALILVLISIGLSLISGLIPALMAARKNPVTALRTE